LQDFEGVGFGFCLGLECSYLIWGKIVPQGCKQKAKLPPNDIENTAIWEKNTLH
jgi:hypothetical protein